MLLKAYNIYLTALKEGHGDGTTSDRNELAIARSLGNNNDSAIFHLNDEAYVFLKTKQFNKAYRVIKASINHLLPNYILYQNMVDYYMATGDKGRAYIYYSRAEVFKYKQPNIISDSTLKIDSSMKADYRNFSKKIGYEVLPPECLVKTVANTILKKGMAHKAYVLLKMNIENYPNSFSAYKEMGNYYAQENDKEKANEYFSKSLILQYKLPVTFFQSSFNIEEYFNSHYEDLSKNKGDKIFFSEPFFNSMGNQFMSYKMFDKAELFFKMNVEHYPQSLNVYSRLSAFYKTTGNIVKEEEFEKHVQAIKTSYQQRGIMGNEILPDTTYNIQVAKPTCLVNCPTISVQINGRWANGRYKPFANLIANDGFRIINSREPFTKQSLAQLMS